MIGQKTLFSSKSDEWETPQEFFDKLDEEFHFDIDLAATSENSKCKHREGHYSNAFSSKKYSCFMYWCNPPYSKCKEFVKFVSDENINCVMLLPSRTDTRWFHEYIYNKPNVEIRFIKGRLKFSGAKFNAPFPSMLVIFKHTNIGEIKDERN